MIPFQKVVKYLQDIDTRGLTEKFQIVVQAIAVLGKHGTFEEDPNSDTINYSMHTPLLLGGNTGGTLTIDAIGGAMATFLYEHEHDFSYYDPVILGRMWPDEVEMPQAWFNNPSAYAFTSTVEYLQLHPSTNDGPDSSPSSSVEASHSIENSTPASSSDATTDSSAQDLHPSASANDAQDSSSSSNLDSSSSTDDPSPASSSSSDASNSVDLHFQLSENINNPDNFVLDVSTPDNAISDNPIAVSPSSDEFFNAPDHDAEHLPTIPPQHGYPYYVYDPTSYDPSDPTSYDPWSFQSHPAFMLLFNLGGVHPGGQSGSGDI